MKRFRFSLQKLLDIKNSSLELLKMEMSKLNKVIEEIKNEIENITEKISEAQERMDRGIRDIVFLREWMDYIQSLYRARKEKLAELVTLEKNLDELREKYAKVRQEQKALEKLKELRKMEHDLEFLREEQRVIDDIALERTLRKKEI